MRVLPLATLVLGGVIAGPALAQAIVAPDLRTVAEPGIVNVFEAILSLVASVILPYLAFLAHRYFGAKSAEAIQGRGALATAAMIDAIARVGASMAIGKTPPGEVVDHIEAYVRQRYAQTVGDFFGEDRAGLRTFIVSALTDALEAKTGVDLDWLEQIVTGFQPKANISHLPMPSPAIVAKAIAGFRR